MSLWDEIISSLELTLLTAPETLSKDVKGAFCGDLLSHALANAAPEDIWITIHRHRNVIAVAALVSLSGVIITEGRPPDPDTLAAAEQESIPLFTTALTNFQAAGRLYHILSTRNLIK